MEQISFFLEKFKSLGLTASEAKRIFLDAVKIILSIELPVGDITYKDGTMYVKAEPAIKSELFLKQRIILRELAKNLGPIKIRNIR